MAASSDAVMSSPSRSGSSSKRRSIPSSQVNLKCWSDAHWTGELSDQYFAMYSDRLSRLRKVLIERAKKRWPSAVLAERVLDAHRITAAETILIGTVVKEMTLRPSPLIRLAQQKIHFTDTSLSVLNSEDSLISLESDSVRLEDEHGCLTVQSECFDIHSLLTGLVVAVKGELFSEEGVFIGKDILFPGPAPYLGIGMEKRTLEISEQWPNKLLLLSSLRIGDPNANPLLWDLLLDYVCNDMPSHSHCIGRVIIAGDSVESETEVRSSLASLDSWLARLASTGIAVDLMPGALDPCSNLSLPQRPFHPCLLPKSGSLPNVHFVSNPYSVSVAGFSIVGCSGQNLRDMRRVSSMKSSMQCLKMSLNSRLIAPSAPDTLPCMPTKKDLLLMGDSPDLYFAGCCDEFAQCKGGEETSLLTLPHFHQTGQCVLFDMSDHTCQVLRFSLES